MKFIVSSSELTDRLQIANKAIQSKNTIEILSSFCFDLTDGTLTIVASDMETRVLTKIEVTESDGNGTFAIDAATVLNILKELPEQPLEFTVDLKNYGINLKYLNGEYNMVGADATVYPANKALEGDIVNLSLDSQMLLSSMNSTLFAIADDELRPIMNGIYFDIFSDKITFVASDGHKLVRCSNRCETGVEKASFVLPKKPASILKVIAEKNENAINIAFDGHYATFSSANYQMTCRLIEGRYPNYNSVIPTNNIYKAIVDRAAMASALRRVSVFKVLSTTVVKMSLRAGEIEISTSDVNNSASAEEKLVCQYDGVPMVIGFSAQYISEIFMNITSENVVIEIADPTRACVIVPAEPDEKQDVLMLIMPMMVND